MGIAINKNGSLVAEGELIHIYDIENSYEVLKGGANCETLVYGIFIPSAFSPNIDLDRSMEFICVDPSDPNTVVANKELAPNTLSYAQFRQQHQIRFERLPLDGIWMRAPYLHNGSVPNLRELLTKPAERVKRFYRGYDVYDPENVGFISDGRAERHGAILYDTTVDDPRNRGNGNGGHEYATELSASDKEALIEYLKTK